MANDPNCDRLQEAINTVESLIRDNGCAVTCNGCKITHLRIRRASGFEPIKLNGIRAFYQSMPIDLAAVELFPPKMSNNQEPNPIANLVDPDFRTYAETDSSPYAYMLVRLQKPGSVDRVHIEVSENASSPASLQIPGCVLEGLDGSAVKVTLPFLSPQPFFEFNIPSI